MDCTFGRWHFVLLLVGRLRDRLDEERPKTLEETEQCTQAIWFQFRSFFGKHESIGARSASSGKRKQGRADIRASSQRHRKRVPSRDAYSIHRTILLLDLMLRWDWSCFTLSQSYELLAHFVPSQVQVKRLDAESDASSGSTI